MNENERRLALADFLRKQRAHLSHADVGLPPGLLLPAGSGLLSALVVDHFPTTSHGFLLFSPAFYPPLGAQPYLIGWAWLVLPAIILWRDLYGSLHDVDAWSAGHCLSRLSSHLGFAPVSHPIHSPTTRYYCRRFLP